MYFFNGKKEFLGKYEKTKYYEKYEGNSDLK
jgi:hypothetical protein